MMAGRKENIARRILVLGLGKTGLSVIRHLVAQGADVTVADSRDIPPNLASVKKCYPGMEIITGRFPYDRFSEFDQTRLNGFLGESGRHARASTTVRILAIE